MWGPVSVSLDGNGSLQFGGLNVHFRRMENEWHFAYSYGEENLRDPGGEKKQWRRFVSAAKESLELMPVLPDRPLVIRPEYQVSIFPGETAHFFISVPVWYRFTAVSGRKRMNIIDIPSNVLSNTWFGDKSAGELCYSLDVPFACTPDKLELGSTTVICTLAVRNSSEERLMFERLCVHVENLSIFVDDDTLWTSEIKVLFKGVDQISQIDIQDRSPKNVPAARKLTGPREISNKSILHRSFTSIRQFAGL
jgi:hypothetical protein